MFIHYVSLLDVSNKKHVLTWGPSLTYITSFLTVIFQSSYWRGISVEEKQDIQAPVQDSNFFEEEPQGVAAGIQVKGLTKVRNVEFVVVLWTYCTFISVCE